MSEAGLVADQRVLRRGYGAVWVDRDFVSVKGPDCFAFLQGQLSQDVNLEPGASAWSLLLQPQGKMVALVRVLRIAGEEYVLDTDGGFGEVVAERLRRFKLRVKAEVEPLAWTCLAIRGAKAHEVVDEVAGVWALDSDWPGWPGVDLVGERPAVPEGVPTCLAGAYETVRIEAGVPRMGREIDESTIPAEAGVVERSVSFTKGCYTGQELVARIDSRGGNVPRHLRGLVVEGSDVPAVGASVVTGDGKEVGTVTSAATSAELGAPVALAYVGRAVTPPADVVVTWDGISAPARVQALPLVG